MYLPSLLPDNLSDHFPSLNETLIIVPSDRAQPDYDSKIWLPQLCDMSTSDEWESSTSPSETYASALLPRQCVMTRSALALDPSLSRAQPRSDPPVFQPRRITCHMTRSHRMCPHACMRSPAYVWPQRVCAHSLLTSPGCNFIYKSHLYSENKLA